MAMLHTTASVIDALGGNTAVADMLGTNSKAVSNWRAFGKFPTHTYVAIREALRVRRYSANDNLWPMTKRQRKSA